MVLVTRQAPDFTAAAVLGNGEIVENFNLKKHLNGRPAVLFFWPMDFTFVCPSELIAFDHRYEEFQNVVLKLLVFLSIQSLCITHGVKPQWIKAVLAKLNTQWLRISNVKSRKLTVLSTQMLALHCVVHS